jgi:hypothetical protein
MLLPGAEVKGLDHEECLALIECAEDAQDQLMSLLAFLVSAERKRPSPNDSLISEWNDLLKLSIDLEIALPGSDVSIYEKTIAFFRSESSKLERQIALHYKSSEDGI